jgi:DNA-binding transcriptional ArsR family regulator
MQGWRDDYGRGFIPVDVLIAAVQCTKRRELLAALGLAPMTVGDLQQLLGYAYSDVSKHLRELRECGLVQFETRKKERVQRLTSVAAVSFAPELLRLEIRTASPRRLVVLEHELHSTALQVIAGKGAPPAAPAGRAPTRATTRSHH